MNMLLLLFIIYMIVPDPIKGEIAPAKPQIDAILLDELLRDIVDSSMSELRYRLQEAVFATAFRRRIQQTSSSTSELSKNTVFDKLLDDYLGTTTTTKPTLAPQKLSLALETYTTTIAPQVKLITANKIDVEEDIIASGRMLNDAAMKDAHSMPSLPRIPVWVALTVSIICFCCFLLFVFSMCLYCSRQRHCHKLSRRSAQPAQMPSPLTVAGLRRSSIIIDHQNDRANSSIMWSNPHLA